MNNNLIILGAGQYGMVVKEIAEAMGCFDKIDFLDDNNGIAIGKFDDYKKFAADYTKAAVAVGNPEVRRERIEILNAAGFDVVALIHPKSCVSPSAEISKGCIIEPFAVIQTFAKLGTGVIICAGSVVGHNSYVEDVCQLDIGSTVKPNSVLRKGTKLEAGCVFGGLNKIGNNYYFEAGM